MAYLEPAVVANSGRDMAETIRVGVKAFDRITAAWGLTNEDAAGLLDVGVRTWPRMKVPGWRGRMGQDQILRLSALVGLYKGLHLYFSDALADAWVTAPNSGPLFRGATPVARMRDDGLPAILATRNYVDAIRGGV